MGSKFATTIGTPQGDSLSPVLFVIYLEAALRDLRHNLPQRPREDINMPHYIAYADDVDFIRSSNVFLNEVQRLAPGCLLQWHLVINESKTEHTNIHKRNTRDVEQWRKTRKLGSLLGDAEDVTRRKQLAVVAFQRMWSLWVRKRHISEGLRLILYNAFIVPVSRFARVSGNPATHCLDCSWTSVMDYSIGYSSSHCWFTWLWTFWGTKTLTHRCCSII